ncbi:hypothetical protein CGH73_28550, partial [Vibrio parahaemolyticus]
QSNDDVVILRQILQREGLLEGETVMESSEVEAPETMAQVAEQAVEQTSEPAKTAETPISKASKVYSQD